MTKNQSTNSSTKLSESEAIAYWEKKDREFLNQLRASGLTVTETAASDGGELTASIPQGKHTRKLANDSGDRSSVSVRPVPFLT